MEVFDLRQLSPILNRPDIIMERMESHSKETVCYYKSLAEKRYSQNENQFIDSNKTFLSAPQCSIIDHRIEKDFIHLDISFVGGSSELQAFQAYLNGVPYGKAEEIGEGMKKNSSIDIELINGHNVIEISCTNNSGAQSLRSKIEIEHIRDISRSIFFIGIANQEYQQENLKLQYTHKDVRDVNNALKRALSEKMVYNEILILDPSSPQSISEKLNEINKNAEIDDVIILYLAGHGAIFPEDDYRYRYLLSGYQPDNFIDQSVPMDMFYDFISEVKAINRIMFIDTCQSGIQIDNNISLNMDLAVRNSRGLQIVNNNVNNKAITELENSSMRFIFSDVFHKTGLNVFSSSRGDQLSFESENFENGLFSEGLIEALNSRDTDRNSDSFISLSELGVKVSQTVNEWTMNQQSPNFLKINPYTAFMFGNVK